MSVCSVTRRYDNTGEVASERNQLLFEVARLKFGVSYNVLCTSHLDGPQVILSSPLVPRLGDVYAFANDADPLATCVRVNVPVRLGRRRWRVEVQYDTDRIVAEFTDNPFQQPPEITGGSIPYEIAMRRDAVGRPVVNSALRPYDPPPTLDEKAGVYTITRNEAIDTAQAAFYLPRIVPIFTRAKADAYRMRCNNVGWQGYGSYAARLNEIRFQRQLSQGRLFWQVTYELEVRPVRKFFLYLLDMSWTDIDDTPFRDPMTGATLQNQTLLNSRGRRLKLARAPLVAAIGVADGVLSVEPFRFLLYFPLAEAFNRQTYFVRVDDEIMEVIGYQGGAGANLIVVRGVQGTVAAAHSGSAFAAVEPYYLRFAPHLMADLNLLGLPTLP